MEYTPDISENNWSVFQMNELLWDIYNRLINNLDIKAHRFLYNKIDINQRLTGIVGPRGTGKTTLLLQLIKEKLYHDNQAFYFSADSAYFDEHLLLEFVDELYQHRGIRYVFIDEVHKYKNWSQELKNIYDGFPDLKVFFSGSSSIDLIRGTHDLSRRARLLHLPGLSFREYLNIKLELGLPTLSLEQILNDHVKLSIEHSKISNLLMHFSEYLTSGYYPFVFQDIQHEQIYDIIENIVNKTIYEDIANFFNLKTANLNHLRRILNFLASMPPGEVKTNNLAQHLSIDNKTTDHYIEILKRTGLIKLLFANATGNQILTKPQKVYLDNSTLLSAFSNIQGRDADIGNIRELAFLQFFSTAKIKPFYPKKGDFKINDIIFEIGGKNKTWQQLSKISTEKYLVKDNILIGKEGEIPLYLFGFLY